MTWMSCALAVLLVQQPVSEGLSVELELATRTVSRGDPLFARITILNNTSGTVKVPNDLFRTAGYSILPSRSPYSYRFRSEHVPGVQLPAVPVAPAANCTIDYEILESPPIDQWKHDFWRINVRDHAEIVPDVWCSSGDLNGLLPRLKTSFPVVFIDRPPEEMAFLTELYAEFLRRDKEQEEVKDRGELGSYPSDFGLASLAQSYPDLVRKLVAYEKQLSPGALQDIVHLVRLTQIISRSTDRFETEKTVEELLKWLDTLPEIERHCLGMKIVSWAGLTAPDEPAVYELVFGVVQRLPQKLYEFQDFRAYRLEEYAASHPRFRDYLNHRSQSDLKE